MKTIQLALIALLVLGMTDSGFGFSAKYTTPNWGIPQGSVTHISKGSGSVLELSPRIISYDKQHIPWFESTLKPQNLKKQGEKELLEIIGGFFGRLFSPFAKRG